MTYINKTELSSAVKAAESRLNVLIDDLYEKIKKLEESNKELVNKNVELTKELNEIKGKSQSTINVSSWANVVGRNIKKTEEQLVVVNAAINEQRDRDKRKKNVLIFGLPESNANAAPIDRNTEDKEKVEKLFDDINSSTKPSFVKRLRSRNQDKPGPLLVVLSDQSERNPLLISAKKLRNLQQYKSVYISPDLTEAERLQDRELRKKRDELNSKRDSNAPFRYAIRGNDIVKLKIYPSGASSDTAAN